MDNGTSHTAEMPNVAEWSTFLCHVLFFNSLDPWQRPSLSVTAHLAYTVLCNLNFDYKKPLVTVIVIAFCSLQNTREKKG